MTAPQAVTQAEFARLLGCGRSYVTALKKADRLVFDDNGYVLVEESHLSLWETADPNRGDVGDRWAKERGRPLLLPQESISDDEVPSERKSKAQKMFYEASRAKLDYEREIGKVVEKSEVEGAIADVVTAFRQRLENMPHRIAPEIVGKDLDAIRATLKQEVFGALAEMEREFSKRIEQMGSEE